MIPRGTGYEFRYLSGPCAFSGAPNPGWRGRVCRAVGMGVFIFARMNGIMHFMMMMRSGAVVQIAENAYCNEKMPEKRKKLLLFPLFCVIII